MTPQERKEREDLRREAVERITQARAGPRGLEAILARISAEVARDAQERLDAEQARRDREIPSKPPKT